MGTNQRRHRVIVKQSIFLVLLVVAGIFAGRYFLSAAEEARFVKVRFKTAETLSPTFRLEVVSTPSERAKGLMFRRFTDMHDDQGMLFIFPEESVRTFWMKNTLIPLDMIFIGTDLTVAGVVASATPLSEEARGVGKPSKYVVELHGGTAKKFGIAAGSKVELPGDLPKAR